MKIFIGRVVAVKSPKTATVAVERVTIHPLYGKRFKKERKYLVHSEIEVGVGDKVKFAASKPFSKLKKWRIIK